MNNCNAWSPRIIKDPMVSIQFTSSAQYVFTCSLYARYDAFVKSLLFICIVKHKSCIIRFSCMTHRKFAPLGVDLRRNQNSTWNSLKGEEIFRFALKNQFLKLQFCFLKLYRIKLSWTISEKRKNQATVFSNQTNWFNCNGTLSELRQETIYSELIT